MEELEKEFNKLLEKHIKKDKENTKSVISLTPYLIDEQKPIIINIYVGGDK